MGGMYGHSLQLFIVLARTHISDNKFREKKKKKNISDKLPSPHNPASSSSSVAAAVRVYGHGNEFTSSTALIMHSYDVLIIKQT